MGYTPTKLRTWLALPTSVSGCDGQYPLCGKCKATLNARGAYGYNVITKEYKCNADPPYCGNNNVEYGEQCETPDDCRNHPGWDPTVTYDCENCQCISLDVGGN